MTEKTGIQSEQVSEKQLNIQGIMPVTSTENEVAEMRKTLLRPGCLNVYVSMPCPLKNPFKQAFKPFVEAWNADSSKPPVFWPTVTDCSPEGIEKMMTSATKPDELPDIFVTAAYNIIFSKRFHQQFIETGIFGGIPENFYSGYPQSVIQAANKFKVGFLGFSSWGMVRDLTVKGSFPVPTQWHDLIRPEFNGLFSMHGCHGHAGSLSMLLMLKKKNGDEASRKFAENTKKIRHFAELIKSIGTAKSETPYYILPYVAIANIPSSKKAQIMNLNRGVITPMIMIVNQSKIKAYTNIIRFFTGNKFKEMLELNAYFQPGSIDRIESHDFADLELLSEIYYDEVGKLGAQFLKLLGNKIVQ